MKNEIVFILEPDVGRVTVEASRASMAVGRELEAILGKSGNLNCARPADSGNPDFHRSEENLREEVSMFPGGPDIYLYRLYHHSTVDGPGRRTVVQVSGCSIRCPGCYVPETHSRENGRRTSINSIVENIVEMRSEHDGVTILGGEPFDQSTAISELVRNLKEINLHITVYTGYTLEQLIKKQDSEIELILSCTDLLIDGAYKREFNKMAGEYRGSSNQRLIRRPLEKD